MMLMIHSLGQVLCRVSPNQSTTFALSLFEWKPRFLNVETNQKAIKQMFPFFFFFLFDQKYAVRTLAIHEHTYFLFYALLVLMKIRFDYCLRVRNRNSSRPYFDTLARKSWAVQCVSYWLGQLFFLQRPAECVAKPTVLAAKESIIDERFLLWPIFSPDQLDIGWRKGRHVGRNLSVIDIVAISVW